MKSSFAHQIQTRWWSGLKCDSSPISTDVSAVQTLFSFKSDIGVFCVTPRILCTWMELVLDGHRSWQTSHCTLENLHATSHYQMSEGKHASTSHCFVEGTEPLSAQWSYDGTSLHLAVCSAAESVVVEFDTSQPKCLDIEMMYLQFSIHYTSIL